MNCGLNALEKMTKVGRISLYSIVQVAKDNGLQLYITKVNPEDVVKVPRPAILHSEDHFTFVENGEALPDLKWTGYVATVKPFKESIKFGEAKKVLGSGPIAAIGAAVIGAVNTVAAVVTTAAGALASGVGALAGSIPVIGGAAKAGLTGLGAKLAGAANAFASGSLGAGLGATASGLASGAGGLAGAAATGAGGALIGAGIGGAKGGLPGAIKGAVTGGTLGKLAGNFTSGFSTISQGGGTVGESLAGGFRNLATGSPYATAREGFGTAVTDTGPVSLIKDPSTIDFSTGAGYIGTNASQFRLPEGIRANPEGGFLNSKAGKLAGSIATKTIGDALGPKPPQGVSIQSGVGDVKAAYSSIRDLLGDDALGSATDQELKTLVATPIKELSHDFGGHNEQIKRQLNEKFDQQIESAKRQYASSGQNVQTSSDLRKMINDIELNRATALREADQELADANLGKAIQVKQFALADALQQNRYDDQLAQELAEIAGVQADLNAAIEQDNFNEFQDILGQILSFGFGSA